MPVYPTLPTQLAAIAREYALPSTIGIVLYLITTSSSSTSGKGFNGETDEPGPRISEEIWKHIWLRVLRSEKDEALSPVPRPLGLGMGLANQSAPTLLSDLAPSPIQMNPDRVGTPNGTGQGSSPSSTSHSAFSSQSELDPPESISSVPDPHADDLPLPGLNSPALVPILAKVEFDIDRRKAGWYSTWVRSRRINHAKRTGSRAGRRRGTDTSDMSGAEMEGEVERNAPINLRLVRRMEKHAGPAFLRTEGMSDEDEDEWMQLPDSDSPEGMEDATERMNGDGDPLADVFGSDAETWADFRTSTDPGMRRKRAKNPNMVDLALDGAALGELDEVEERERGMDDDDDIREVEELWENRNRPSLTLTINGDVNELSSPATAATIRKNAPPPLHLEPSLKASSNVIVTVGLHYWLGNCILKIHFKGASPDSATSQSQYSMRGRSPLEEKREGAIFDELNLGLDDSGEVTFAVPIFPRIY